MCGVVGPLGYVGSAGFLPKHGGGVVQVDRVVPGWMERGLRRFFGVERVDRFLVLAIRRVRTTILEMYAMRWAITNWRRSITSAL